MFAWCRDFELDKPHWCPEIGTVMTFIYPERKLFGSVGNQSWMNSYQILKGQKRVIKNKSEKYLINKRGKKIMEKNQTSC